MLCHIVLIMEKYYEALAKAQKFYDETTNSTTAGILEEIFPQLRKHEGERIRQEIITYLSNELHNVKQLTPRTNQMEAWLRWLDMQMPVDMIQWKGDNLKEVIDFAGKAPQFEEWFNTWEEYETYVHDHDDIFKIFNADGSHLEVPVGTWIVRTPDGKIIPSVFKLVQGPAEEASEEDEKIRKWLVALIKSNEYGPISNVGEMPCPKLNVLAWLEIKGKQKPTDWNHADEAHIHSLITHLEQWIERHPCTTGADIQWENVAWLKKLGRKKPMESE